MVATPPRSAQEQFGADNWEPDEEQCSRFAPCCSADTLIETNELGAVELLHPLDRINGPDAWRGKWSAPRRKLWVFQEATVTQRCHNRQHLNDEKKQTITDP